MKKFKDIQKLLDDIRDVTGKSCNISVEYWSWSLDCSNKNESEVTYNLYISGSGNFKFKTVSDLITKIKSIIDNEEDEGISL